MKICLIGTGYVGLVTGTCFAETGNDVICVDIDEEKIALLRAGTVPIFEPGLEEMVERNVEERRLSFSTDLGEAVRSSDLIFIAVGTPPAEDGSSDLRHVLGVAQEVARAMDGPKIIVNKSTVPVGTGEKIRREIESLTDHPFSVVSNPEFLKEGAAIEDFMKPDRIVVGTDNDGALKVMSDLYAPFTRKGPRMLAMDLRSAEMTKYASNAMLACRISFMNEISLLCERLEVDVEMVRQGVGSDQRIGRSFLFPGVGYGGSCFPKDIKALIGLGRDVGFPMRLIEAVDTVNRRQKRVLVEKLDRFYSSDVPRRLKEAREQGKELSSEELEELRRRGGRLSAPAQETPPADLSGRCFAVWGLSFKPRTDDMREAPSLVIIESLLERGAEVQAYDPEAMSVARGLLGDRIRFFDANYHALEGADALLLITEWDVFRTPNFARMKKLLKDPVVFDGRNQYQARDMLDMGFICYNIGRP